MMTSKRESRKEREKQQRKQEVLHVALGLFSKRGFGNVTMQEIADEADYAVGTLYNLFENKERMFDELCKRSSTQIKEAFLYILKGPFTERERLSRFILSQPGVLEKHSEVIKMYITEMGQHYGKQSQSNYGDELRAVITSTLSEIIEEGIKKGMFHPVDHWITAKAITALLETLTFEIVGPFNRKEVSHIFQKVETLFLDNLLASRPN